MLEKMKLDWLSNIRGDLLAGTVVALALIPEALLVKSGFEVKSTFLDGNIFDSIMDYKIKNNVEMLVMGAFSHSKLAHAFLGSNTLKMIENTQLPMVILR